MAGGSRSTPTRCRAPAGTQPSRNAWPWPASWAGFFDGRSIVDLETLAFGAQNVLDTYSQVSVIANAVGEQYSEYTPCGDSGAYYYVRIGYDWGN